MTTKTTIDLHMHTKNSDGSLTTAELLTRAEKLGLTTISITDHDTVGAYIKDLPNPAIRKLFSGKIIPGIELGAICKGNSIEILGYGIDVSKMAKLVVNYPSTTFDMFIFTKVMQKLADFGIVDNTLKLRPTGTGGFLLVQMLKNQTYREFFGSFNPKYSTDANFLFRDGFMNKKSPLFVSFDGYYRPDTEIIKWIHDCGGKAFLAHPAQYYENTPEILETLKDSLDGIECFHYSADKEYEKMLMEFCKKNKLLMSGGSDFHGDAKPDVELGVGKGDTLVPKSIEPLWLNHLMQPPKQG